MSSGRLLGHCQPNPAILNNRCHVIFADNCRLSEAGTDWDEHEEMEVSVLPEAEVMQWAKVCKVGHVLALVGLLFFQLVKG